MSIETSSEGERPLFSKLIQLRVPYYQRLHIIRFIYYRIRFNIRDDGLYIGKFYKRKKVQYRDYIRLLYGFFKEDPYRKPFLIHQKITYTFVNYYVEFKMKNYIPRKHLGKLILLGNLKQVSFKDIDFLPIECCVLIGEPEGNSLLSTILKISPNLEQLYYNEEWKNSIIESSLIDSRIRKLKELKFRARPKTTDYKTIFEKRCDFRVLRFPHALEIEEMQNLPNLQHLSLSRASIHLLNDEKIKNMVLCLQNNELPLISLELNELDDFTMDGFLYILKHLKSLRKVTANYARLEVSEAKRKDFDFENTSLRTLHIKGVKITQDVVLVMTNICTSLNTLDMSHHTVLLDDNNNYNNDNPYEFILRMKKLKKLFVSRINPHLSSVLDREECSVTSLVNFDPFNFYVNPRIRYLEISRLLKSKEDLAKLKTSKLISLSIRIMSGSGGEEQEQEQQEGGEVALQNIIPKEGEEDVLIEFIEKECSQILQFQFKCSEHKKWWGNGWKKWFRNINM